MKPSPHDGVEDMNGEHDREEIVRIDGERRQHDIGARASGRGTVEPADERQRAADGEHQRDRVRSRVGRHAADADQAGEGRGGEQAGLAVEETQAQAIEQERRAGRTDQGGQPERDLARPAEPDGQPEDHVVGRRPLIAKPAIHRLRQAVLHDPVAHGFVQPEARAQRGDPEVGGRTQPRDEQRGGLPAVGVARAGHRGPVSRRAPSRLPRARGGDGGDVTRAADPAARRAGDRPRPA